MQRGVAVHRSHMMHLGAFYIFRQNIGNPLGVASPKSLVVTAVSAGHVTAVRRSVKGTVQPERKLLSDLLTRRGVLKQLEKQTALASHRWRHIVHSYGSSESPQA